MLISAMQAVAALLALYVLLPFVLVQVIRVADGRRVRRTKVVHLTFDDGPDAEGTPLIKSVLDALKARATFFLLSDRLEGNAEIVESLVGSGHEVGEHGAEHLHPWTTWPWRYAADLLKCHRTLSRRGLLQRSAIYRPTYGKANLFTVIHSAVHGARLVFWDVDPKDYQITSPTLIVDRVVGCVRRRGGGAVVLLHDGRVGNDKSDVSVTAAAVERIVTTLQREGYRFDTISSCLQKPAGTET